MVEYQEAPIDMSLMDDALYGLVQIGDAIFDR